MMSNQTVGDHELFLGQVLQCFSQTDRLPLVYWRGGYRDLDMPPEPVFATGQASV